MRWRHITPWLLALALLLVGATTWLKKAGGGRVPAAASRMLGHEPVLRVAVGGKGVATIFVHNSGALSSALKSAQSGDVIKLAPGSYSDLNVRNLKFSTDVTITSADLSKPAVITNFTISDVTGVTFSHVEMSAINPTSVKNAGWAFRVMNSDDIHFDHVKFYGSLDGDAANDMNGLQIRFGDDISVTNSKFQQFGRGLNISEGERIKVAGNEVSEVRTDGMDFVQVGHVEVTDNFLHDFTPSQGDHPDAIQFWTKGTTEASHDILISGNLIMRGDGQGTQGIFMTDQVGTLPYERVTISDNLIIGTGYSAVRIVGGKDITISGNELITLEGGQKTWMLTQKVDGLVSTDNKAISIGFDRVTDLSQSGNIITTPADDLGVGAIRRWLEARPGSSISEGVLPLSEGPSIGLSHGIEDFVSQAWDSSEPLSTYVFAPPDFLLA